ncbi:unnamed protein product [Vicia faba]|uniref:Fe2OG dioxygenase domain-containing protein n=1 Tax=Vicia faba TaxID=3906 RepID=A0AAV1A183_VICFA|nr:unnamed protein product [Vicia faba]
MSTVMKEEVLLSSDEDSYDRAKEVKEFDETKAGVKGLTDSGIINLPRFLIHPQETLPNHDATRCSCLLQVPVIDFTGHEECRRLEIIGEIKRASETWGFFQMVNHGVPDYVMDDMLKVVKEFHEQANWRDTILFDFQDGPLDQQAYPLVCREAVSKYMEHILKLKEILSELLPEALGLKKDYLANIKCMKSEIVVCHYYPPCPQPELTFGTTKHSDPSSLTILLQDTIGGLQVLHQNQWIDITPIHGALVANIGDFMQLISNDKFKSVEHRVLARSVGPRASAACHMYPDASRKYRPIEEFTSNENPPKYRETNITEYLTHFRSKGLDGHKTLPYFRL